MSLEMSATGNNASAISSGQSLAARTVHACARAAGTLISPSGPKARLSILIYHQVLPAPDPLKDCDPDADTFRWQMTLAAERFNVLSLTEAAERLRNGTLPARALCITFDDGYADNARVALPILREFGLTATFFVASSFLNGGRMWNDTVIEAVRAAPSPELDLSAIGHGRLRIANDVQRLQAADRLTEALKYLEPSERGEKVCAVAEIAGGQLPDDLMMRNDEVVALHAAGMEIGGHTRTHPILANLAPDAARREICENKEELEGIVRGPVRTFAYPNGRPGRDYRTEHAIMLDELGFEAAVSTAKGVATRSSDPFQLPRFTPWDTTPLRFGLRLLLNCTATRFDTVSPGAGPRSNGGSSSDASTATRGTA